jgi:hypothetical protein
VTLWELFSNGAEPFAWLTDTQVRPPARPPARLFFFQCVFTRAST